MKNQSVKFRAKHYGRILFAVFLVFTIYLSLFTAVSASEKWPGVDESVIEKFAKEYGIESKEPLINTDQGDLLLFVFLIAGTVGGFTAGYYFRTLTEHRIQIKNINE